MPNHNEVVLLVTDKSFVDYTIPGGVQLCTQEFITYFQAAGFDVKILRIQPTIKILTRLKIRLGIEVYDKYKLSRYEDEIKNIVIAKKIKTIVFNQVNLCSGIHELKKKLPAYIKFVCLSHGNESGDYLHEISYGKKTTFLQSWRLGKLIVKENHIFKNITGIVTISEEEASIDKWIGADKTLNLPRILKPDFMNWQGESQKIGFVGTLDHSPNLLGIRLLAKELANQFTGEFVIVGGPEFIGLQLEKEYHFIRYKGRLTDQELKLEVKSWVAFLNPVFWYARGSSTKLAQAMNWGLPVLSTPAGARGYQLTDTRILVEDNRPKTFATAVIKLIQSSDYVNQLKLSSEANCKSFQVACKAAALANFIQML